MEKVIENFRTILVEGKEYVELCKSSDIFERKGSRFFFGDNPDNQVAVFRIKGNLYALANICPHRHQDQIFNGIIEDLKVICPVHGWTYSLETGENVELRQGIRSLKKYNIIEQNGVVYLEKPDFEPQKWKLAEE